MKYIIAYLVHTFTALSSVFGLFCLYEIYKGDYSLAFLYIGITIFIDAIDGTLARMAKIKVYGSRIDGALLDNIIDFLTYVTAPAFLILVSDLVPEGWRVIAAAAIMLSSSYQFTQSDAKTDDHFFKGFPCYWNILVFYLLLWHFSPMTNLWIILSLVVLVFIPIKYIYPSQLSGVSKKAWVRWIVLAATIGWSLTIGILWWTYPMADPFVMSISVLYMIFYTTYSIYLTWYPLSGHAKC